MYTSFEKGGVCSVVPAVEASRRIYQNILAPSFDSGVMLVHGLCDSPTDTSELEANKAEGKGYGPDGEYTEEEWIKHCAWLRKLVGLKPHKDDE